ncbi:acyltransferase [Enterocloster bolteae]|uniref:acyltransferase n=1 Tax=Enterocloster bolteae TaxID=208479 RepID=UPI00210EFA51|nr:DapH/DapD/GlmU-related protein [Enterocloster bolteae]MCQ5140773.1 acyltransferase [Enterocloster bolteae]
MRKLLRKLIYRIRGEYTIEQLKKLGLEIGENFDFQLGFELDPSHCWLISIGDNVTFGPHVQILAHDASTCKVNGYAKIGKVRIGNNVFIGAGSIILPNVIIGDNSVIGAGSVVTHSVSENTVVAGNPARVISTIQKFTEKNEQLKCKVPVYGDDYTLRKGISEEKKQQQRNELTGKYGFVK